MSQANKPPYKAFVVKEYGKGKAQWTEIGVVWEHKSGTGFNLDIVDGLAVSGRIVILPALPAKDSSEES